MTRTAAEGTQSGRSAVPGRSVDPDAERFRRASTRIGVRVALLSTAMIVFGAVLLFSALWWKSTHDAVRSKEATLTVSLDPGDLALAGLVLGTMAVLVAGLAAVWFAHQAVAPLEESMRRQRQFVSDASHELRTPLAVVSARVQQVGILSRGDERIAPVVRELRQDCDALSAVVGALLAAAAGAQGAEGTSQLESVATQVVQDVRVLALPRGVHLELDVAPWPRRWERQVCAGR